jgi:hypothetical protein
MNARDSFGIVLRTIGLLLVLYSIRIAAAVVAMWFARPQNGNGAFGLPPEAFGALSDPRAMLLGPSVTALIALAIGAYLLRGAPAVLAYSYPEPQRNSTPMGMRTAA